jgi:C1A family cysteine protease
MTTIKVESDGANPAVIKSYKSTYDLINHEDPRMPEFLDWANKNGKNYEDKEEFAKRFNAFIKTYEALSEHNSKNFGINAEETEPHLLELNKFADWTDEEYKSLLGFKPDLSKPIKNQWIFERDAIPDTINWVEKGVVSPVKDQGSCGSCWSFSTTGSIESAYQIKNGSPILLSEQQLVDCSISYGNNGCSGGLVEYAYNYAKHVPLETEAEYPYHAKNEKCQAAVHSDDV